MKARIKSTGVLVDVTPQLNINSQHSGDYANLNMDYNNSQVLLIYF